MRRATSLTTLLVICLSIPGCKEAQDQAEPDRPVLSVVVQPLAFSGMRLIGVVEPQVRTELGFRVLGRLIARDTDVGDFVRKGQQVAAIDPTAVELAVRSAQADLSSALAQLSNAAGVAERQRILLQAKTSSQAQFETSLLQQHVAEASVDRAEANLAKAKEQLGYAQLHAEFDGVVTSVSAEVGQIVSPGQIIVTIAQPNAREAVVDIPDSAAGSVTKGEFFEISLELDPTIRVDGTVREIAPQADLVTRTHRIRISLLEPPDAFRLGTTVIVTRHSQIGSAIILPASAVLERDEKTSVWVVDSRSATVSLRKVVVVSNSNGSLAIASGLEAGSRVVTAGVNSLHEGQKVRIDAMGAP